MKYVKPILHKSETDRNITVRSKCTCSGCSTHTTDK